MNEKELMIDDWYLASEQHSTMDGDYTLEFYPKRLMIDDLIFAKDNDWDELDWTEFTKPIPLTAEILEKNGWKIDMYSTFDLEDGKWLEYYHHEARLRKYWRGVDEWQNHAEVKEINFQCKYIRYVHELQQALRRAGLKELADNFKI